MPGVRRYAFESEAAMKTVLRTIGSVSLVLAWGLIAHAKEWRGIVPLHSTRADVERLLGAPFDEGNLIATYRTKDAVVTVFYATGSPCEPGALQSGWVVPRDTVIRLTVRQVYDPEKGGVAFSELGIDKSKLKETGSGHVPDTSYFTDEEEGVTYEVGSVVRYVTRDGRREAEVQTEVLKGVAYTPAAKDRHRACPSVPSDAPNNGMHPTRDTTALI
jgi:hypothetical protein